MEILGNSPVYWTDKIQLCLEGVIMKLSPKILLIVLFLCLCIGLSFCQKPQNSSGSNDSYLEGIEQGELNAFMDLWDSHYDSKVRSCGKLWKTDDFSLTITAKRGSRVDANIEGSENNPYLEVDFTLHGGTIDEYRNKNKILFYIYSFHKGVWTKVWNSDDYYWYFYLQSDDDKVGSKGNAETRIPEETEQIAVIVVIDGCTYATSYYVNIR